MRYPKGYQPSFNLCDNILKHLNTAEMRPATFDKTLLIENEDRIESLLEYMGNAEYIKYNGGLTARILAKGVGFISNGGFLKQMKAEATHRWRDKYWWLLSFAGFLSGIASTLIIQHIF